MLVLGFGLVGAIPQKNESALVWVCFDGTFEVVIYIKVLNKDIDEDKVH